jgi:hypothetical protein
MTLLDCLDDFWITKYECQEGSLIVGGVSTLVPVSFAVCTSILVPKNKLYAIADSHGTSFMSETMPSPTKDKWAYDLFSAATILSDEIVSWLKEAMVIHSKSSGYLN